MLQLESICKKYSRKSNEVVALHPTTLEIPEGDFVSIIGPSGSGKTTLLSILGAMSAPTEGKLILDGESVYDLPIPQRAKLRQDKIGFVFQTFNLIPYLTALENVQVPLAIAKVPAAEQLERAKMLLEKVGLESRMDHKPDELSVGQQQRVALARMLVNDPAIILADEPTGNLDPETKEQVMSYLTEFNEEGRTIIMVTHDLPSAKCAKRVLTLSEGHISPEESSPVLKMA